MSTPEGFLKNLSVTKSLSDRELSHHFNIDSDIQSIAKNWSFASISENDCFLQYALCCLAKSNEVVLLAE